jgi:hypothetical protein
MNQQFGPLLYTISVWALPAIIAITFQEAARGFVARLLGDDTAWHLGRVTFNPRRLATHKTWIAHGSSVQAMP